MRIWSIHPEYLDTKGLVALWRETLLAKHVLAGKTKGYINHPQLLRFKTLDNPGFYINQYLCIVFLEAKNRGFNFDRSKIIFDNCAVKLPVTTGQLMFERNHLLNKLKLRDPNKYYELLITREIKLHPLFYSIEGDVEDWEKF